MSEPSNTCSVCGTLPVPGAGFCHRCGAPIGGGPGAGDRGPSSEETAGGGQEGPPPEGEGQSGVEGGRPIHEESAPVPPTGLGTGAGEPPPGAAPADSDERLAAALEGRYEVRIGDWMSRGWNIFTRAGGLFIAFGAIVWAIGFFAAPLMLILGPVLSAGFLVAALKVRAGDKLEFSDFWTSFNDFLPLFLACLVGAAFLVLGLCTCGVATVYLWVGYQFAALLILDRRLDFWEALEASRKIATRRWLGLFAFALVLLVINILGLVIVSVGIVVTLPLTSCALAEAYADICGVRGRPGAGNGPGASTVEPARA